MYLPVELLSGIFVHLEKLDKNLYSYMTKEDKIRFLNNVSLVSIVDNIDACIDYKNLLPKKFNIAFINSRHFIKYNNKVLSDEFMMTFFEELFESDYNSYKYKYLMFRSLEFLDFVVDKYSYRCLIQHFNFTKTQLRYAMNKFKLSYPLKKTSFLYLMNHKHFLYIPKKFFTYNDLELLTNYKQWYALSSRNDMLTLDMIEKYHDKVCWNSIAACYKLPLLFISKYLAKMDHYIVLHSQKLPLEFIIENFTISDIKDNFKNFSKRNKRYLRLNYFSRL